MPKSTFTKTVLVNPLSIDESDAMIHVPDESDTMCLVFAESDAMSTFFKTKNSKKIIFFTRFLKLYAILWV